jgi:adenine-specific DNA-methyltransferase
LKPATRKRRSKTQDVDATIGVVGNENQSGLRKGLTPDAARKMRMESVTPKRPSKAQRQQGALGQKRADYAFSLAPNFKQTKFFVEAKKPSRTLRQNKDDYFQTAKYGWNAGTGISILTDFEELVIIDCRFKPDIDTIIATQLKYYHFADFRKEDVFEELYWLFSREAVEAGNLERHIEDLPKPKGIAKQLKMFGGKYQSIDESFLNYIDQKRQELAAAFYNNNKTLDAYSLTEATQRTIDRIVFIRFLEDKLIETDSHINAIANSSKPWAKFIEISKQLNAKYNGIVFKPFF